MRSKIIIITVLVLMTGALIVRNVVKTEEKIVYVKDTLYVVIKVPGENGYIEQQAILETALLEILGQLWNYEPQHRNWIEKYIIALSEGKIKKLDKNKKLGININLEE